MTMFVVSLVSAMLLGALLVIALWPRGVPWHSDRPLILPLAVIVGLGATSMLFFGASLLTPHPAAWSAGLEFAFMAGLAWIAWRKRVGAAIPEQAPRRSTLDWVLATLFVQAAVVSGVVAWRAYRAEPYGGWDGWAIWNLHARFMLRAGPAWPQHLLSPQLSWSHPDYPWLVPASVARAWAWSGAENPAVAATISALFGAAVVALLVAFVAKCRSLRTALLAGLVLLGTPFFVTFSSNEHADIPLAAFLLATGGLLALGRAPAVAGLCAGLAAWTKNEGLLFVLVVCLAQVARARAPGAPVRWRPFAAGLALGLAPVAYFKLALAPPGDLLAAPLGPRWAHLFDGARHSTILGALGRDGRGFGEWSFAPFLAMALPFVAWRARRRLADGEQNLPFVVVAMLLGYYGVYLLTPQDLAWHLETSLVRLLLQLWPLALLWWALLLPGPAPSPAAAASSRLTAWVFLAANACVAIGIVALFAQQLAPDEFVLRRYDGANIRVATDAGWYGVEHHARQRWAWSRGEAALAVEVTGAKAVAPTLRLQLRSLVARTVMIRVGDQVVWSGAVGENYVPVTLRTVTFPPGTTLLAFATDAPPVDEPTTAGARQLAFAIYNLRLE